MSGTETAAAKKKKAGEKKPSKKPKPNIDGIAGKTETMTAPKSEPKPEPAPEPKPELTKAQSFLKSVYSGTRRRPPRILLYGTAGIGKSTWASEAPNPIFIQTEEGLDEIDTNKLPLCKSHADVINYLQSLITDPHDYKTLAIDSMDHLERLIWAKVAADKGKPHIDDIGFYRGYGFAADEMSKILSLVDRLRNERKMGVILIAHSAIVRFENPEGESFDRFGPRLNKHASAIVQEWCDAVIFAGYRVMTKTAPDSDKAPGKGIGTGERVIRTVEKPAWMAKNRYGLPQEMPLKFSEFTKAMKGTVTNGGS